MDNLKVWGQSPQKAHFVVGRALCRFRPRLGGEVTERIGRGRWRNEVSGGTSSLGHSEK